MSGAAPLPPGEDPEFEAAIAFVLRGGLYVSIVLVIVGLSISTAAGPPSINFSGVPRVTLASPLGTWGAGIVFLGLLILVLTPVFRVGYASWLFAQRQDRPFTVITLFVLLVLVATFLAGALR